MKTSFEIVLAGLRVMFEKHSGLQVMSACVQVNHGLLPTWRVTLPGVSGDM